MVGNYKTKNANNILNYMFICYFLCSLYITT